MRAMAWREAQLGEDLPNEISQFINKTLSATTSFIDDNNFLGKSAFLESNMGDAFASNSPLMRTLFVIVSIVAIMLALLALNALYGMLVRFWCSNELGIKLPRSFRVRRTSNKLNEFHIGRGAHWQHAKKDGTRDKRRSSNKILYTNSVIIYKGFRITGTNPLDVYKFALKMRKKGHTVAMSRPEQNKFDHAKNQHIQRSYFTSANAIYETYKHNPYEFETFVGSIYANLGYTVQDTAKSNDGGIDLKMFKANMLTVVECKCYAPTTTVGRPIIQKLVGSALGFNATGKIVVTTASFSSGAIEYALDMGVELVDGSTLIRLARQSGMSIPNSYLPHATAPWELTEADLLQQVPNDLKSHVYGSRKLKQPV